MLSDGRIADQRDVADVDALRGFDVSQPRALAERRSSFDAAAYDRLRVLSTELRRVQDDGGSAALRVGRHVFSGDALGRIMRGI